MSAYDCVSYKQLLQHGNQRSKDSVEEAKLVRVQLTKNQKSNLFKDLSHLREVFEGNSQNRKSFSSNSQLIGSVGLGNPVQEFKFIFDTSRSNMWVTTLKCENCDNKKRYNSSASTTYINDGRHLTTDGGLGFRSIDQVSFGDVVIKNQTYAEVFALTDYSALEPYDGLFCLGIDGKAQENIATPLRQMLDQGLIEREVFAIYQNSTGGEIVFGGVDESHYTGIITWVPLAEQDGWTFKMDSLELKKNVESGLVGETVCEDGCNVNIGTYLPCILGPQKDISAINEAMGAEDDQGVFILADCDLSKLSNLVFKIGGAKFELTPEQYIQKVEKDGETVCVSLIQATPPIYGDEWFIGSPVIGNIYTVFYENKALGFANAK